MGCVGWGRVRCRRNCRVFSPMGWCFGVGEVVALVVAVALWCGLLFLG